MTDTDATVWNAALGELQLQMTRATFDTWLRGSVAAGRENGTLTVAVRHAHAVDWLQHRLRGLILATLTRRDPSITDIAFVAREIQPAPMAAEDHDQEPDPLPARPYRPEPAPADVDQVAAFDPSSAGWWQAGHYATWYWAALLGPVAWRIYELVVADYKTAPKAAWSPPRRYSVSELARAIAAGRNGRGNRSQITGRWRTDRETGERIWTAGAFDALTMHNVGAVEWHDGSGRWQAWTCGGTERQGRSSFRIVYRIAVVTHLPLLTPSQVALLATDHQVGHERYLVERGVDIVAWEQIAVPTLAGGTL